RDKVYVYFRYDGTDKVMVVLSQNEEPVELPLAPYREMLEGVTEGRDIVSEEEYELAETMTVGPRRAYVIKL
ncbi:MAG: cyclomaltodextrinase C-terminal domain-containing protein, partial [Bacteroidota bacterium]